jgi:hypothetical protein
MNKWGNHEEHFDTAAGVVCSHADSRMVWDRHE